MESEWWCQTGVKNWVMSDGNWVTEIEWWNFCIQIASLFPLVTQLPSTNSYSLIPSPSSSRHRCSLSFLLRLWIFFIIFSLIFFSLHIHARIVEYTHPTQIKSNKNSHQQILVVLGSSYLGLRSDLKSELERPKVSSILCFPWGKDGEAARWAMV